MPYAAGGAWVPAPGVSYAPPTRAGDNPRPIAAVAPHNPAQGVTPSVSGSEWVASTLSGSRSLNVGGSRFRIPREALVKTSRRAGVVWVNFDKQTFILSELGLLRQTDAERRSTRFDLL